MAAMNIYTVSFFGHRYIERGLKIEHRLDKLLHDLITQKEYVDFLIGRDGEFDLLASAAIKRAVRSHGYGNKDTDDEKHEVLSTEQYFSCSTDDRLYWWGKDSDVILSEETKKHLCQLAERHKELYGNLPEGDIMSWQKRLVNLLSDHPKIYCFEQMFYEFIGSFHDERYKAAVLLLEGSADNEEEYRRLLAVFANRELRKYFFSF